MWEAREGRSRRHWSGAVRQDAANEPRKLLGEVLCGAPPATVVVVPGFLAQSTHLEPEAMCEANETVGLSALPEPIVARSDFLEVGGGDFEIEREL